MLTTPLKKGADANNYNTPPASITKSLTLDKQVWIVADARLDGRQELMELLRAQGREIDQLVPRVELVLHAYHVWDTSCV